MRQVISVSLPRASLSAVKQLVRKRGHRSVSGYLQSLIEADREIVSEEELLKTVQESRKEHRAGKSIRAKSVADLV